MKRAKYRLDSWILVVEDDVKFGEEVRALLERMRLRSVSAKSPSEAAAKLQNQRFSCVLLDLWLDRGMSGERIVEMLRESPFGPNGATPILVMSGFLDQQTLAKIAPKVNGILLKPFKTEDLQQRLIQLLKLSEVDPGAE